MLRLYSCDIEEKDVKKIDINVLYRFYKYYKIQHDYLRPKPDKEFNIKLYTCVNIMKKEIFMRRMFQILLMFEKHRIFDFYMIHYFMTFL